MTGTFKEALRGPSPEKMSSGASPPAVRPGTPGSRPSQGGSFCLGWRDLPGLTQGAQPFLHGAPGRARFSLRQKLQGSDQNQLRGGGGGKGLDGGPGWTSSVPVSVV